jgi:aerobic carbon-monoxide dehydrogenase large subunit
MQEVAFLRSPVAHARIRSIGIPPALRHCVFIADDLIRVRAIKVDTALAGFKSSSQPVLAVDKVRHFGEPVAMCIAPTCAEAEDIASRIEVDFAPLPEVRDMVAARQAGAPLVHDGWGDNLFLTTDIDVDFAALKARAAVAVVRELRTSRQVMSPLEGRGVVAYRDSRLDQLVVISATQQPHIVRSGLECLGIDEGRIRVISPDVGGGFGYKGVLLAEEIALAWATGKLGHPLRWIEDRRENLTAGANCREHHYRLTAYADRDGRLLGLECEATVDAGAYSAYPFSACLEAGQIGSILPGVYDFPHYRCRTYSVATNKPPILPYRGVARTGVGIAMYSERAGHGTSVYAGWRIPFVRGYQQCQARFTPDGGLELRIGAHSHGQRRRCPRSPTRCSAYRTSASNRFTATPRRRPTRAAPGARVAPSCRAARWPPHASNWPTA